ncbi:MAG: hypothetical protein EAY75_15040 [Bacteroidetes bacterium]|nr:MAG: hypothetical protein EAY75_15040 [Bacteroidota bacterium]
MAKQLGILLNNNYDLHMQVQRSAQGLITQGLVVGDVLYQNQAVILQCHASEIKSQPALGVGIGSVVLDADFLAWRMHIRQQMELDGQVVQSVLFGANKALTIDAFYP